MVLASSAGTPPHTLKKSAAILAKLGPNSDLLMYSGRDADERLNASERRTVIHDPVTLRDRFLDFHSRFPEFQLILVGDPVLEVLIAVDEAFGTYLVPTHGPNIAASAPLGIENVDAAFELFPGSGATASRSSRSPRPDLVVPATAAGMPVLWISRGAFARKEIRSLFLSAPLRSIGRGAFFKCTSLSAVVFPRTLQRIGRSAFNGCAGLEDLDLPLGVHTIAAKAFAYCPSLRRVSIPKSVTYIAPSAFEGCAADLRMLVEPDSYGERWAREHGFESEISISAGEPAPVFRSERIHRDGVSYVTLPGNIAEVLSIETQLGSLRLPESVDGYQVRGIAPQALPPESPLKKLVLPTSMRWIATDALSQGRTLSSVQGLRNIQAFSDDALPLRVSRRTRPPEAIPRDIDAVRLSLRMVAHMLDTAIPVELENRSDTPFPVLSASVLTSTRGALHFQSFKSSAGEVIDKLHDRGVGVYVSNRRLEDSQGTPLPHIIHPAPRAAFERVCSWIASQYEATTIALTGSVGKTTTKELVQLVASTSKRTIFSQGNQNGVAQVGRYIQKLDSNIQVYIQETGAARPGLVESDARMLHPNAFIITNIGFNHIGNYGGLQENILKDKISHDRYLPDDGVAFVNYDDPKLRELKLIHEVISYGVDSKDTSFYADSLIERDGKLEFDVVERDSDQRTPVVVHAFGKHNVSNAVVAFAVGRWLGIGLDDIVHGISLYRGEGLRQNLAEIGGQRVLIDCYNSSENAIDSTARALETIAPTSGGRRVLVLADIDDKLGTLTEEIHRRVGVNLAGVPLIDRIVCFGPHARWIAEEAQAQGLDVIHTEDRDDLYRLLRDYLRPEDVVAFKGGQQMALSITIDHLFGTSYSLLDGDVLVKRGRAVRFDDGSIYRQLREYGAELVKLPPGFAGTNLVVPEAIDGVPVLRVAKLACQDSRLTAVSLSEPMMCIATSAFFRSRELRTVALPDSLRTIERSAFNNCTSLEEIDIPDGVTSIGRRAFYRCSALTRVRLPGSLKSIGSEVFGGCTGVTIECPKDSAAEAFCRENWPDLEIVTY